MYVIFPADEVVYLSYGRLIYVPTATQQQQGRNQFAEPVPVPAPIPSSAHSTGSYTTCPSPSIPSTSSSNRSFRSTASSPLVNGYGDNCAESKSKGGKTKSGQLPKNKSDSSLIECRAKPGNSKELASSNDNVFLKVPTPARSGKTEKRLSYSDFLPVHKCLKETKPATKKSLKNTPLDFDDLFKRETTPTKGILRSSSQTTSESRLQLSGLQLTPEKSPTKKKTFFSSSPKPEPRIKRTSDFGYATKMAASDTSSLKDLTHPSYNELLKGHNGLTFKLIRTVSDFTQQLSQMYEQHAQELQHLVAGFRKRNGELRKERPSCPSTLFHTWETLLQEVEIDSQALGDIASIMGRQVSRPLLEKSFYRKIQSRKVFTHRESYEAIIGKTEEKLVKCRQEYKNAYVQYLSNPTTDTLSEYFNAHNAYVQQLHATNGMLEEYHKETLPQLLQELEEIYIDLCSTLAEAVLQGAEVVSARAIEQCKRYDGLSAQIKNLNGATDIIHLARALPVPQGRAPVLRKVFVPPQPPAPPHEPDGEDGPAHHHHHHLQNEHIPPPLKDELVIDRLSALQVKPSHDALRKEAGDLEGQIRQIHDSLETLVKLQHRSVEASLFNKANEIQEDISMKKFDLRVAQIHLSAINSQRELFSNKLDTTDTGRERKMSNASQGSMKTKWLKAFKSLKTPPPESEKKNGSAATKELLKGDPDAHNFQENTYKKITPCDVCSQVLRGHTRQGLKCRICKINVHVDCQEKASKCTAKARLLRRQKSTSEIETRVPEMTVEEEIIGIDASYSGMPTMNRQLSSPHPTTALIDRRAAQGPSGSESSMRRRIFAGMKSLTGFGSRSRHGSPGHRSISLPEKRKSTDASGTRPFGQPLMLCPPQFENGGETNDLTSMPPTPPSPSPSKGKLPAPMKKGAKPKK